MNLGPIVAQIQATAESLEPRLKEVEHAEARLHKAQAEFGDLSLKNQQARAVTDAGWLQAGDPACRVTG